MAAAAKAPDRQKTGLLLSIAYPRILALRFKRQHVVEMLLRVSMCVQVSMRMSTYAWWNMVYVRVDVGASLAHGNGETRERKIK